MGRQVFQIRQRCVLLSIHEHLGRGYRQEAVHQIALVGEFHHRLEDSTHGTGPDLVPQTGGIQSAREVPRIPGSVDEFGEEAFWVIVGVVDDLPRPASRGAWQNSHKRPQGSVFDAQGVAAPALPARQLDQLLDAGCAP
ncbi:hypothetical protein ACNJ7E_22370 [Rhodococcus sp. NM-2]|uniref:hypothetical protein n=1 Tax=Rhodococcus sp. NM-2 TaxID=3401174 RepID=UPI003AADABC5